MTIRHVTRPVGRMVAEVVGDVSKLGPQMQRDVQRALARVDVNLDPQFREIAADADRVFAEVARDADASFDLVERDADEAADRVGDEFEQGGERAERAFDEAQDRARREFNQIGDHANTAGGNIGKVMTRAALAIGAAFAAVQVAQFFITATGLAEDLGSAVANTAQIIEATGGAAGLMADEVRELSRVLGLKIGVDSVEVQNAANILLTFKAVSKDTFSTALALAADMSAVLGSDLKGAALQVGKALNDPIKGVGALARAGVQFTDQQKDQIKALIKSGDLLGAQNVILGELKSQVGGVALAGADITDKLAAAFTDLKREAGEALIGFLDDNGPALIALIQTMGPIVGAIGGIIADVFKVALPLIETFASNFQDSFARMAPALEPLVEVFAALFDILPIVLAPLGELAKAILPPLTVIVGALVAALTPVVSIFAEFAGQLVTALLPFLPPLAAAFGEIAAVVGGALGQLLPPLAEAMVALVEAVLPLVPVILELVLAMLPLVPVIADVLGAIAPLASALAGPLGALAGFLADNMPLVWTLVAAISALTIAANLNAIAIAAMMLIGNLWSAASKVWTGIQWALNIALSANPVGLVIIAIAALVAGIILAWKHSAAFRKVVMAVWNAVKTAAAAIGGAFVTAWKAVVGFFSGLGARFEAIPGNILKALMKLRALLISGLKAALDGALRVVGMGIGLLLGWFIGFPHLVWAAITKLPGLILGVLRNLWNLAAANVRNGIALIVGLATTLPGRIWDGVRRLPGLLRDVFVGAFRAAREAAANGISRLVGLVSSLPDRIRALAGRMLSAGASLIRGFLNGLKRIGGFAADVGAGIVRAVKGALNSVINSINSGIASIDAKLPFNLPRIPNLATGGLTQTGGLANLHPNELVLPLQDRRAVSLLADAMREANAGLRSMGVPTVGDDATPSWDVRVYIGDRELTDLVDVHISRRDRQLVRRVTAGGGRRSNR